MEELHTDSYYIHPRPSDQANLVLTAVPFSAVKAERLGFLRPEEEEPSSSSSSLGGDSHGSSSARVMMTTQIFISAYFSCIDWNL